MTEKLQAMSASAAAATARKVLIQLLVPSRSVFIEHVSRVPAASSCWEADGNGDHADAH